MDKNHRRFLPVRPGENLPFPPISAQKKKANRQKTIGHHYGFQLLTSELLEANFLFHAPLDGNRVSLNWASPAEVFLSVALT
jgi:hypothetical protein